MLRHDHIHMVTNPSPESLWVSRNGASSFARRWHVTFCWLVSSPLWDLTIGDSFAVVYAGYHLLAKCAYDGGWRRLITECAHAWVGQKSDQPFKNRAPKPIVSSSWHLVHNWGNYMTRLLVLYGALIAPCLLLAAEIRVIPADYVVLNPTNVDKGFADLVVHTICVATGEDETLTLRGLDVEVLSKGHVVLKRSLQPAELVGATSNLAHAPFVEYVTGQLLNQDGLNGLFGRHVAFADSTLLRPSTVLTAMRIHFSVNFPVDAVRVAAAMTDGDKHVVTVTKLVPIHAFTPLISYHSPLTGTWLMQAVPGVQSHHRFNPSTEFAEDFFKVGPDGHVAHGDPFKAENFYGYGAPVLAAAAGTVVVVIADQNQDRPALIMNSKEKMDHFLARVDDFHMKNMAKNFRAANAGNLITIRHEHNGMTEYTSYGHLQSGSVKVRLGEKVEQGQQIAAVGDTGDSAEVHLHFQVNAGPDAFTSKSLPAHFSNLYDVDNNTELGRFVSTTRSLAAF
jgi:hypothetical protein